jgi:hypothetical protein
MKAHLILKAALYAFGLLALAAAVAPYIAADQFGGRLQSSLQRALGRRVDLEAPVRFSLLHGPAFRVANDNGSSAVVIHEDPSIGIEPIAYVGGLEVRPSLWHLLFGRFVIASIRLEDATINLTKSGPAQEWGRWNFASFVNRSIMRSVPAIHVRNGRINFKFGDEKSVFYLTETDLDISPPGSLGGGWDVECAAKPARTDRTSMGLGSFTLNGRWYIAPERVAFNLELADTGLGEITALLRGDDGGVHGTVSSRLHLAGPINNIGIVGRLNISDVHRWDLLPPKGRGWPLDIRGRLDLVGQRLELASNSARDAPLPLSVRFRASEYLSQPHWAVAVNWNQFPVGPLMQLANDMGAQIPPKLQLSGTMDGAIGYSGAGSFQGTLAFHDAALTIPDSPVLRFDRAYIIMDHGHVRLSPAAVRDPDDNRAEVEADYAIDRDSFDLSIVTAAMKVASLRAQVSLAAVPWLEQVEAGEWDGQLHYHREPSKAGWSGDLHLRDARVEVPGLAAPVELASVHAQIDGGRVSLDHIHGQAGKTAFAGEYRYEPGALRPHKVRLVVDEADATDLEAEFLPTISRSSGLIARALGRAGAPEWLKNRDAEGTIEIADLLLAGAHFEDVHGRILWNGGRIEIDNLHAGLDRAAIAGALAVNLRGSRPAYRFTGKVMNLAWQSGTLDAQGTLETAGTGAQLLANLASEGTFSGTALDLGTPVSWRCISGAYSFAWSQTAPKLRLTGLNLRNGDESYTGEGSTQSNGRLVVVLTNGTREMRVTGAPGNLRIQEAAER